MKSYGLKLLLVAVLHLSYVGLCCGTCLKPTIRVPVDFAFKDSQYQSDWMYRALDPVLLLGGRSIAPDELSVDGGKLSGTFCISTTLPDNNLKFVFGPRQLEALVRPVGSDGAMAPIHFLVQPAPDWLVVRSAQWNVAVDGSPLIDVSIYNPSVSDAAQTGPSVHLLLTQGPMSCFGSYDFQQIDVKVAMKNNAPSVVSKDEPFPDPVKRHAAISSYGCDVNAEFELGTTHSIEGGRTFVVRFKLQGKQLIYERKGNRVDLYSWDAVPGRVALFKGGNIFPKCIIIEEEDKLSLALIDLGLRSCGR